jgi:hypothetical protein
MVPPRGRLDGSCGARQLVGIVRLMLVRGRVRTLLAIAVVLGAGTVLRVAPARAQERYAVTVTSVLDGDTLMLRSLAGMCSRSR